MINFMLTVVLSFSGPLLRIEEVYLMKADRYMRVEMLGSSR